MKIERFEELTAWKEARKLNLLIYKLIQKMSKNYELARQMFKCSISIMANIAEGFGRYSFKDKRQFFSMARGSITEMKSHCYAGIDIGAIG